MSLLTYAKNNVGSPEVIAYSHINNNNEVEMKLYSPKENNKLKTMINPSLKDIEPILIANDINNPSSNHLYEEEKNNVNQEKIIEENFINNYSEYSVEENKIKINNNYIRENQFHNQNTNSTTQDKKNIEKNQVTKETNNTNKNAHFIQDKKLIYKT